MSLNASPTVRICEINPTTAARLLASANHGNRTIRERVVAILADSMKSGRWLVSPDAIAFTGGSLTEPDQLLNGQHRLAACVKADVAIRAICYFNADPITFEVCDRQSRRSGGDALAARGFHNTAQLSSVVVCLNAYANSGENERGCAPGRRNLEPDQIRAFVERYKDLPAFVDSNLKTVRAMTRKPAAVLAALYLAHLSDPERAAAFRASILTGTNAKPGSVALLWRERMISSMRSPAYASGGSLPPEFAWTVKAFNAYRARTSLGVLRWGASEALPSVTGCPITRRAK